MQKVLYTKQDIIKSPVATLLLTHGLGEHCRRYDDWVFDLNQIGISIFRYDLPGHGRSRKGNWLFKEFEVLEAAIVDQYNEAREYSKDNNIPLFLFGHSMGGLITADFVIRHHPWLAGVILSAPALDAGEVVKPWMIRMAGWMRKILPGLPILQLPPDQISRDPEVVAAYKNDPQVYHGKIRINTGYALLSRMEEVNRRAGEFELPVLILQGQADQFVRPEETSAFFERLPVKDKTWCSYAGMYHEVLNDSGNERVKEDIKNWILKRL